ncbi:type II toxin-antitoxin system HipA family toxin [Kordiimonas sp.]|uniref:type II toxin-antitoxin system HipA family toxin n=1 Tax=Kordiimonas sp. TaxID=1970157 RepID=UPI003B51C7CE
MSSTQKLGVYVATDPTRVGDLHYTTDGPREFSKFVYNPAWMASPTGFPIAPHMPFSIAEYYNSKNRDGGICFPSPVQDACPDSWGRDLIRKSLGRYCTEFDYLTEINDLTRQGALRFKLEGDSRYVSFKDHEIPRINRVTDIRAVIEEIERNPDVGSEKLRGVAGSGLGGARPKSDVIDDDGSLWLAKYTSVLDTKPVERAEAGTLLLGKKVGINTAHFQLEGKHGPLPVTLLRRFDRDARGGRRHYISGQTMLGSDMAVGHSYLDLLEAMGTFSMDFRRDARELFRRVAYTILLSNHDDHMKNHGFLMQDRDNHWRLSPMFDVNPQPERAAHLETAIAPGSSNEASLELLFDNAAFFAWEVDEAVTMVHHMAQIIRDQWRPIMEMMGMSGSECRYYARAIEHDQMDYALKERYAVVGFSPEP